VGLVRRGSGGRKGRESRLGERQEAGSQGKGHTGQINFTVGDLQQTGVKRQKKTFGGIKRVVAARYLVEAKASRRMKSKGDFKKHLRFEKRHLRSEGKGRGSKHLTI